VAAPASAGWPSVPSVMIEGCLPVASRVPSPVSLPPSRSDAASPGHSGGREPLPAPSVISWDFRLPIRVQGPYNAVTTQGPSGIRGRFGREHGGCRTTHDLRPRVAPERGGGPPHLPTTPRTLHRNPGLCCPWLAWSSPCPAWSMPDASATASRRRARSRRPASTRSGARPSRACFDRARRAREAHRLRSETEAEVRERRGEMARLEQRSPSARRGWRSATAMSSRGSSGSPA